MSRLKYAESILQAAEQWKKQCLLGGGSIFSNEQLWTSDGFETLNRYTTVITKDLLDAPERRIIMDTKYYTEALGGRRGAGKLRSTNLYQLLAYLRNRQATEPTGARHEGILLYPEVDAPLAADIRLEGFRIQARTIDLGQDWKAIHRAMLQVIA